MQKVNINRAESVWKGFGKGGAPIFIDTEAHPLICLDQLESVLFERAAFGGPMQGPLL